MTQPNKPYLAIEMAKRWKRNYGTERYGVWVTINLVSNLDAKRILSDRYYDLGRNEHFENTDH